MCAGHGNFFGQFHVQLVLELVNFLLNPFFNLCDRVGHFHSPQKRVAREGCPGGRAAPAQTDIINAAELRPQDRNRRNYWTSTVNVCATECPASSLAVSV